MHHYDGGEARSITTQRQPKPYPLSRLGCCAWISLSLTSRRCHLTRLSLGQGEVRVTSISNVGNTEGTD